MPEGEARSAPDPANPASGFGEVDPEALVLTFVKNRGRPGIRGGQAHPNERPHARFVCLHHYDEVLLHTGLRDIESITRTLKEPVPNAVAARRILGFRLVKDSSDSFTPDSSAPLLFIVLLRVNRRIDGLLTVELEKAVIEAIKEMIASSWPQQQWSVYRTFAKKELILLLRGASLRQAEMIHQLLDEAEVTLSKESVPLFDMVESWPCVSNDVWSRVDLKAKPPGDDHVGAPLVEKQVRAFLDEQVDTLRAMRVVGGCSHRNGNRNRCSKALDARVREDLAKGAHKFARPITGVVLEREIDRPRGSVGEVISDVKLLRTSCDRTDSCCSAYLVRSKDSHCIENQSDSRKMKKAPVGTGNYWTERLTPKNGPDGSPGIYLVNSEEWNGSAAPLDSIRNTPGCFFIGAHLEEARERLLHALNNPAVASEFEDLIPFTGILNQLAEEYTPASYNTKDEKYRSVLKARAQNVANYLDHAIKERQREDLCSQNHHAQFAPLSASGFSRISPVGSYSVIRTLRSVGQDRPCICVNGFVPVYRELGSIPILNSSIRSTLEPFHHFGLGHEAGHILEWRPTDLDRKSMAATLGIPEYLKLFSEFVADAFCFYTTFCGNIQDYLAAWVPYYFDTLEYDLQSRAFVNTVGFLAYDKIAQYVCRLVMTSFLSLKKDNMTRGSQLWVEATKRVREAVDNTASQRETSSLIASRVANDAQEFHESALKPGPPRLYDWDFFTECEAACEKLLGLVQVKMREPVSKGSIAACVQAWEAGQIVMSEVGFPLAALAQMSSHGINDFSRNVAAMVSISTWDETSRFAEERSDLQAQTGSQG